MRPGDVDRPGIEISGADRSAVIGAPDLEDVPAVGPEPPAVQFSEARVFREGDHRALNSPRGGGRLGRARLLRLASSKSDSNGDDPGQYQASGDHARRPA